MLPASKSISRRRYGSCPKEGSRHHCRAFGEIEAGRGPLCRGGAQSRQRRVCRRIHTIGDSLGGLDVHIPGRTRIVTMVLFKRKPGIQDTQISLGGRLLVQHHAHSPRQHQRRPGTNKDQPGNCKDQRRRNWSSTGPVPTSAELKSFLGGIGQDGPNSSLTAKAV